MTEPQKIGKYIIEEELGRGGMAIVYRAYDSIVERHIALKLLPQHFLHDVTFVERFQQEVSTVTKLEHNAIVRLYDFGWHDNQPYIVMPLMTGGTLADKLKNGPLSLTEINHITKRICSALDKAHSRKIVHRDIKPQNILFDEDNEPYLSDFGIAKITEGTATLTIIGTPQYMSPEQAHGESLDPRTDVYQMGVVRCETGTYDWSTGLIYKDGRYFDPALGLTLTLLPLIVWGMWRPGRRRKGKKGMDEWLFLGLAVVVMSGGLVGCQPNPEPTPDPTPNATPDSLSDSCPKVLPGRRNWKTVNIFITQAYYGTENDTQMGVSKINQDMAIANRIFAQANVRVAVAGFHQLSDTETESVLGQEQMMSELPDTRKDVESYFLDPSEIEDLMDVGTVFSGESSPENSYNYIVNNHPNTVPVYYVRGIDDEGSKGLNRAENLPSNGILAKSVFVGHESIVSGQMLDVPRMTLAHELGHFLMNDEDGNYDMDYHVLKHIDGRFWDYGRSNINADKCNFMYEANLNGRHCMDDVG